MRAHLESDVADLTVAIQVEPDLRQAVVPSDVLTAIRRFRAGDRGQRDHQIPGQVILGDDAVARGRYSAAGGKTFDLVHDRGVFLALEPIDGPVVNPETEITFPMPLLACLMHEQEVEERKAREARA